MATEKPTRTTTNPPKALARTTRAEVAAAIQPRATGNDNHYEVSLTSAPQKNVQHLELNSIIRHQLESIKFENYQKYMNGVFPNQNADTQVSLVTAKRRCGDTGCEPKAIHGTEAYESLRVATECWLQMAPICWPNEEREVNFTLPADNESGKFFSDEAKRLNIPAETEQEEEEEVLERITKYLTRQVPGAAATPYLEIIVGQLKKAGVLPPSDDGLGQLFTHRYECPEMIELIWSYWHEEGMLSQTMNAIAIRFQNRLTRPNGDPLANLEIDPLRPLNNLLWGWIQSEYTRLSVQRRAYEYTHHYGLSLIGKAVPPLLAADSRSKFLEAFHSLLRAAHVYYMQSADATVNPDGFPLLNALRALHLVLAEGAHNQYGDLPWTSRVEMLIEQWLLSRPEMRDFLRGRTMVPYAEGWMGQVDAMKKLQGWTDVSASHFHELATCGEAVLLSVRHGYWAKENDQDEAKAWASYWRPEIQRYIYAYKAVTGADLTMEPVDVTPPAHLLKARLARQDTAALRY